VKRWWLMVALLLSLGFNLGLLAAVAGGWWASRGAAERPAVDVLGEVRETAPAAGEATAGPEPDPLEAALPAGSRELSGLAAPGPEGEGPPAPATGVGGGELAAGAGAATEGEAAEEGAGSASGPPWGPRPWSTGEAGGSGEDERIAGAGAPLPGPPLDRLADHLRLEGERREEFLAVQRELFRDLLELRRRRAALTVELHRELAAPRPDEARIEELVGGLGEAYAATEGRTARAILDSRALLEPEQQRRYLQVLRHLLSGGPRGSQRGPGPGPRRRLGPGRPPG
jgi:hypothetical protein